MPWVRVDDHFDEHPKMAAVGPVGWGVWLAGLAYCNRNLTDGFIPYAIAEGIGGSWRVREPVEDEEELENGTRQVRNRERIWSIDLGSGMHGEGMNTEWVVTQLVRVGLWEPVEGGYRIHDYGDYQPSKEAVLRDRRAAADRQAALRGKSQGESQPKSRRDTTPSTSYPVPTPVPTPVSVSKEHARTLRARGSNGSKDQGTTEHEGFRAPSRLTPLAELLPGVDLGPKRKAGAA